VDAALIAAPSSTKNNSKSRDPEMHQTKKDHRWRFGMKAHIGKDADSSWAHTLPNYEWPTPGFWWSTNPSQKCQPKRQHAREAREYWGRR
jgi:hypothetical protein